MRLVALLALCCGCNQVFGLETTQVKDVDGGVTVIVVDAPRAIRIDSVQAPSIVNTNDEFMLSPFVHGPPNETALYSIETSLGLVTPAQGDVALDGNGVGQIVTMYRAPAAPGSELVTFNASDVEANASLEVAFSVTDLTSIGIDMTTANIDTIAANRAIGARINVASTAAVKKLGIHVTAAPSGAMVKMGLYSYSSGNPVTRHGATAPAPVIVGRNEVALTSPVTITPGDYFVIAVFDQQVSVPYVTNGLYGVQTFNFPMTMMNPWSGTSGNWIAVANLTHCMFMRAGQ